MLKGKGPSLVTLLTWRIRGTVHCWPLSAFQLAVDSLLRVNVTPDFRPYATNAAGTSG